MAVTRGFPMVESTSPRSRVITVVPSNIRDTIQRSINRTSDQQLDEITSFSVGRLDGRYGFPVQPIDMRDYVGRMYHIVGVNTSNDWSVAGP